MHTNTRKVSGESMPQSISQFIAAVRSDTKVHSFSNYLVIRRTILRAMSQTRGTFAEDLPLLPAQDRATLSKVLNGRPLPDEAEVARRIAE